MDEHCGRLLDLYPDPDGGLTLWLLDEEEDRRLRLRQPFPVIFYAAGPPERLRAAWRFLQAQGNPPRLWRDQRRDLFQDQPLTVLAVEVPEPARQPALFHRVRHAFPDLHYYNADLHIALRHAAIFGAFPLAKLRVRVDAQHIIQELEVLDSPWELDPLPAPLRIMQITPDCDPRRETPARLQIQAGRRDYRLNLEPARPLLINLQAILKRYDPDLLLIQWGDTWLLPYLLDLSEKLGLSLALNRDERLPVLRKAARSYQAYGQTLHRGEQVQLFGRWHLDPLNAILYGDYGLAGVLESARVSALPVQQAARLSPGAGISAMQAVTALRQNILVPWNRPQAERPKTALDLLRADQGGLVYQPIPGLHADVAEIDFVSMYPSIMKRFNLSPETIGRERPGAVQVPELDLWVDQDRPGLVPQTLSPLLDKRIALKARLAVLPKWDPRRAVYKARAAAHKWLLVTCFGYLGFDKARFGRIEAHQAVTAYSRECLLRAKEAAEDLGYTVLHLYVDGLWVQKPGCNTPATIQSLLDEVVTRTGLPIALDGVYRWVVFLTSRQDSRLAVANRYFGVFQDGSLKVRGIEARRRDTPPFIAVAQMGILERLAHSPDAAHLPECIPEVLAYLHRELRRLRRREAPLESLLITQRLSRDVDAYCSPSPVALAAGQLAAVGKPVQPGQTVRFLYLTGKPGVHAWNLPFPPDPACLDMGRYTELFLRACLSVLQPLGFTAQSLRDKLLEDMERLVLWKDSPVVIHPYRIIVG